MVKQLPTMQETRVQSLGWEDLLEKEMATHSSILAWKIPWTRSLVSWSPWGRKESDTIEWLHFHFLSLSNCRKDFSGGPEVKNLSVNVGVQSLVREDSTYYRATKPVDTSTKAHVS